MLGNIKTMISFRLTKAAQLHELSDVENVCHLGHHDYTYSDKGYSTFSKPGLPFLLGKHISAR